MSGCTNDCNSGRECTCCQRTVYQRLLDGLKDLLAAIGVMGTAAAVALCHAGYFQVLFKELGK